MDAKVEEEQLVYEMVKDKIDNAEDERQLHRLSSGSIPIPKTFADITEGEQPAEQKARESIKRLEIDGLMSIGSQYFQNLHLKLQEIEQAKAELSEDNTYYKQLVAEYDIWKSIYKQAKIPNDRNISKPIPKPKPVFQNNTDGKKRLGSNSDVKEASQKNLFFENSKCLIL
ncbi:uncharacterized protein LOC128214563 [Mya arenaria]|uniref:uncharacterized protein LOC128214563 n=1 Tax=Mya arenaria TaxID=6604 RepID=UPI0022E007F4|nr:uncharacterized protein LOC128214563 [Mya arenaria]